MDIHVVELRDLATDIAHVMVAGFPGSDLSDVLETLAEADGVIAVSPVFSASYSGLFKSFFDVLDNTTLTGKPVLLAATGGTDWGAAAEGADGLGDDEWPTASSAPASWLSRAYPRAVVARPRNGRRFEQHKCAHHRVLGLE